MTEELTPRRFRPDDLPALLNLWDVAGWGPVDPVFFRRRYLEGPLGPAVIMVAENSAGELVATSMWCAKEATLLGQPAIVGRGRAGIVAPSLRRRARGTTEIDADHPLVQLRRAAEQVITKQGWNCNYNLPNPVILPFRSWFSPRPTTKTDLSALKMEFERVPDAPAPLEVRPISFFHGEYDRLWVRALEGLGIECSVLRNSRWLNHLRMADLKLECRLPGSGEVVGYTTFADRQDGRLNDVLAVDHEALSAVLVSSMRWLRTFRTRHEMRYVSSIDHPLLAAAHEAAGAQPVDPQEWLFSVTVRTYGSELGPEHDPSRWFVTAGD